MEKTSLAAGIATLALASLGVVACGDRAVDAESMTGEREATVAQAFVSDPFLDEAIRGPIPRTAFINHLEEMRAREATRSRMSEPGRISDLAFIYYLQRDAVRANYRLRREMCETMVTRLAYLRQFGEAAAPPYVSEVSNPLDREEVKRIITPMARGMDRTVFGERSFNNRYIREAAALNTARLVLADLFDPDSLDDSTQSGCFDVSISELIAPDRALYRDGARAVNQIFFPGNNSNLKYKYPTMTDDGAYKEGAGYLLFAYDALMPFVFFHEAYAPGHPNLFFDGQHGIFDARVPGRLRALHTWLIGSQNEDGTWPQQDDSGLGFQGTILDVAIATHMLNKGGDHTLGLRNNSCAALSRGPRSRSRSTPYSPSARRAERARASWSARETIASASRRSSSTRSAPP